VIIPCHNGLADTRVCIASLLQQVDAGEIDIVVVDNGSTDDTPHLARELAGVEVVCAGANLGFAAGVNRGLAAARGDLVLVINNDTRAAPHMLSRLQRALGSDSRIALAAPVSNHVKGAARVAVGSAGATAEGCAEVEASLAASCAGVLEDVDSLAGLCLLGHAAWFREVGGFDPRFGIGNFEDDDLCLRARLRGERLVIARDAFLHHHGHRTFTALSVDYRTALRERFALFVEKWRHDPAGRAVIAGLQGDAGAAVAHAAHGLRLHPAWPDGHRWLGKSLAARGDRAAAARHLAAFVAACPFHGEAQADLALLRLDTDAEAGHRRLAWAMQHCFFTADAGAQALVRLARHAAQRGDRAGAVAWYRLAVGLRPEAAELHDLLGTALLEAGELEEALRSLRAGERLGSTYGATNTGICLWRMGQRAEALAMFHRGVARAPHDPISQRNLAAALRALAGAGA
jgi:GT2 family glycosyltransferase